MILLPQKLENSIFGNVKFDIYAIIPEGILRYKEVIVYHFYLLEVIVYPFYYFTAKHGTPINLLQILNEFVLFCFKAFLKIKNKKCVKQIFC